MVVGQFEVVPTVLSHTAVEISGLKDYEDFHAALHFYAFLFLFQL